MGNIVGEGFDSYVIDQINKRQEKLGSINKTPEQLVWEYSKTSWVKLVSSANVTDLSVLGGGWNASSQPAEKYVLFNGTTDEISNRLPGIETLQRGGLDNRRFSENYGVYGLGNTQWGFTPMPGILSANIKTEAMGSLRTATVNVKANNRDQFELINTLYLRLGYLMLLEWGNNCYYKNDGTFIDDTTVSLTDPFIQAKYSYNGFLEQIKLKRQETNGNYDALVGKVVNYNWTFNKDGSYDITIILRSIGDVIESLKMNILDDNVLETNEIKTDEKGSVGFNTLDQYRGNRVTSDSIIVAFAHAHSIGALFAAKQYEFFTEYGGNTGNQTDPDYGQQVLPKTGTTVDYIVQEFTNNNNGYYIRFGEFLEQLKKLTIPKIKTNAGLENLLDFGDTSINNETTISYSPGKQISADPRICNFRYNVGDYYVLYNANDAVRFVGKNQYIKLMNVYFNFVYILRLLEELREKDGRVPLIDLLNKMWDGYCRATGNFNKITSRIDADTNQIIFIDETALPDRESLVTQKGTAIFNIYGLQTNINGSIVGGSFVRDLQLKTEITPELATMVTIGSTANGYVPGQDATTLSNLNLGTIPRISSEIVKPNATNTTPDTNNSLKTEYKNSVKAFNSFVQAVGRKEGDQKLPIWNDDAFNNFTNTQVQLLEYEQKYETNKSRNSGSIVSSPNNGFLPFNLSLTMDGLSGMKIYQRYTIDSTFLPKMYSNAVDFIIKGISHNIQNNIWTTNIESLAIPKKSVASAEKIALPTPSTFYSANIPVATPPNFSAVDTATDLRTAIVETALAYARVQPGLYPIGGDRFNEASFTSDMQSVGYNGTAWCNLFTKLVWKKAYEAIGKNNANIKNIASSQFGNFSAASGPITSYVPFTFDNMFAKGKAANWQGKNGLIKLVPGDMVIYDVIGVTGHQERDHIGIVVAVNYTNGTFTSVDGNFANKVTQYTQPMDGEANGQRLYAVVKPIE
jgi:hypothetical protein